MHPNFVNVLRHSHAGGNPFERKVSGVDSRPTPSRGQALRENDRLSKNLGGSEARQVCTSLSRELLWSLRLRRRRWAVSALEHWQNRGAH